MLVALFAGHGSLAPFTSPNGPSASGLFPTPKFLWPLSAGLDSNPIVAGAPVLRLLSRAPRGARPRGGDRRGAKLQGLR